MNIENKEIKDLNLKEAEAEAEADADADADVIANKLLKDMVKIKTDIKHFEIILESLKIKYKDTQKEYSNIYALTTEAKKIELGKKEKQRLALEIDKALFLERQQNKLLKVAALAAAAVASKNIGKFDHDDADSIDL